MVENKKALRLLADRAVQSGVAIKKCPPRVPTESDLEIWARSRNKQNCYANAPKATRPRTRRTVKNRVK